MTLRQEALQMMNDMPDEWILPILAYMRSYKKMRESIKVENGDAFERLLSHAKPGIGSGNYKRDLTEMLVEKYERIS